MDDNQKAALASCADSFEYFAENFVKINHPHKGLIPFKLYEYQKRYIDTIEKNQFVIGKKFRQGGFTSTTMVYFLWCVLFKDQKETSMIIATNARVAQNMCNELRHIIRELPTWISEEVDKINTRDIYFKNGNTITFRSYESSKGRSVKRLYIDEAAFVKKMDDCWKAMYPTLHACANCIVMSTPNGLNNWFYRTYQKAVEHLNRFTVYYCEYTENPELNDDKKQAELMKNLGLLGYRQEILAEFIDTLTLNERFKRGEDLFCEIDSADEVALVKELEKKAKPNFYDAIKEETSKKERFAILDGTPAGLVEFEPVQTIIKEAPCVYDFKKLTPEDVKRIYTEDCKNAEPDKVEHPPFDTNVLGHGLEDMARFWQGLGELCPEWENLEKFWTKAAEKKANFFQDLEDKLEFCNDPQTMFLAGVEGVTLADAKKIKCARPDLVILYRIMSSGEFPDNLALSFRRGRLCVNEIPTVIREDDVRDLYNGLYALKSYDEAISTVVATLKEKLRVLFRKEDESNDGNDP